jgi:hypothetical protein
MEIHILDIIVWFIGVLIIWKILEVTTDGESTEELGGLVGLFIIIVYSIIYLIIFGFCDYDVSNISELFDDLPVKFSL